MAVGPGSTFCATAAIVTQGTQTRAAGSLALFLLGGARVEKSSVGYGPLPGSGDWQQFQTCVTATTSHTVVRVDLYLAGAKKSKPDTKVTELELAGHINATCTLDGWSPELIKCFDGVKSDNDLAVCAKRAMRKACRRPSRCWTRSGGWTRRPAPRTSAW